VGVDEQLRHDRVLREYRLRGLGTAEAEAIYQSRQIDETPVILAMSDAADRLLNMPLAASSKRNPQ
jgi:hypothetical protein